MFIYSIFIPISKVKKQKKLVEESLVGQRAGQKGGCHMKIPQLSYFSNKILLTGTDFFIKWDIWLFIQLEGRERKF